MGLSQYAPLGLAEANNYAEPRCYFLYKSNLFNNNSPHSTLGNLSYNTRKDQHNTHKDR
jgi:hypothetical protein